MTVEIDRELRRLSSLKLPELKRAYEAAWGEACRSNNRPYLIKRTAWRLQALAEGGLSERARRRAEEIARDEDLRVRPPPEVHEALRGLEGSAARTTLPPAGTVLSREYLGRRVEVTVLERGFLWEGATYKSLTAAARAITGSDWNGRLFFGLSGEVGREHFWRRHQGRAGAIYCRKSSDEGLGVQHSSSIDALRTSFGARHRRACVLDQLLGLLVHEHERPLRIVRPLVDFQHVLHGAHELGVALRTSLAQC